MGEVCLVEDRGDFSWTGPFVALVALVVIGLVLYVVGWEVLYGERAMFVWFLIGLGVFLLGALGNRELRRMWKEYFDRSATLGEWIQSLLGFWVVLAIVGMLVGGSLLFVW